MKRFLTVLGTGFVLGLIVAPESGRRFRSRLAGLFQPARRRARKCATSGAIRKIDWRQETAMSAKR